MTLIHIHAPRGDYIGQVRKYGHRRWETVTGKCKSAPAAMRLAMFAMSGDMKRARVLFCTRDGWYEPNIVMELSR